MRIYVRALVCDGSTSRTSERWFRSGVLCLLGVLWILFGWLDSAALGAELLNIPAVQRQIEETDEAALEVSKAVPRVRQENADLRASLSAEKSELDPSEVTLNAIRQARLEVDTVRSRLATLEDRMVQEETALARLREDIGQRSSTFQDMPAQRLATLAAKAELGKLEELEQATVGFVDDLRQLRSGEAEHLALARERLAWLQSSLSLEAIQDNSGIDDDPRAIALRAIVSRLNRDGTRLANQAAAIESTSPSARHRERILAMQADDAVARGTLRLTDLDLLQLEQRIEIVHDLIGDSSIPVRVLQEGLPDLGRVRARLHARLDDIEEEQRGLAQRRELIDAQDSAPNDLIAGRLASVQGLEELLAFHRADVTRLQTRAEETAELLTSELRERELMALGERQELPLGSAHQDLLIGELALLPSATLESWRELVRKLVADLAGQPTVWLGLRFGMVALLLGGLWWLQRVGLSQLVANDPDSKVIVPIEALRRTLLLFAPAGIWAISTWEVGLDREIVLRVAGALLIWPLLAFVLRGRWLLETGGIGHRDGPRRSGRLIAAAIIGTVVLLVPVTPMLPSIAGLFERLGFIAVGLAALGAWRFRDRFLGALKGEGGLPAAWFRFLEVATLVVPGLLLVAALAGLAGWVSFGWTIAGALGATLVAMALLLVLVGVLDATIKGFENRTTIRRQHGAPATIDSIYRLAVVLLTIAAVWFLAAIYTGSAAVAPIFWVAVIACAAPFLLQPIEVLIAGFLRMQPDRADGSVSIWAICVERLARALLIIGAILAVIWLLDVDLRALAGGDTLEARLVRSGVNIALVALVADFVWHLAKTMIDQRLAQEGGAEGPSEVGGEGGGQGASRIGTLLPLFRKFLLITLAVMVVMLVLSSLGVDIGPLLAGAGVVGLAIGFGAQTLVKDIVSGMFFLFDDAFRIGEYIDIGEVRGTVENISIRSLRLRHHRGALHTIPFGEIQHLTNHSRDWVIMKLQFRVPYETDLSKVKKIFKKIGAEMKADPTIGPNLLDPPKSQGVLEMDDSAMVIRAKFMAKPGEQFIIRRELYQRVQKEFEAAGIQFARRQVSVYVPPDADQATKAAAAAAAEQEAEAANTAGRVQAAE